MRRTAFLGVLVAVLALACIVGYSRPQPVKSLPSQQKPKATTAGLAINGIEVRRAPGAGSVIFAKTRDGGPKGPADVFRVDLATGKAERLISAEILPQGVSGLALSPDGKRLAIVQGDELDDEQSIWLWTRGGTKLRLLTKGPGIWWQLTPLRWSPSGRYLLIDGQNGAKVYSLASGETSKIEGSFRSLAWLSKRDSLLGISWPDKRPAAPYLVSLDGKRQLVVRWPKDISSVAESPNGRGYAFCDGHGVYLVKNGSVKRLSIKYKFDYEGAWNGAGFVYDTAGTKLAVLAVGSYGEPHVNSTMSLWSVRPVTGKATKLTEWQDSQLHIAEYPVSSRDLIGWLADGKSVALQVDFTWGEDLSNLRRDQHNLDTYDTAKKDGQEDTLFSSGEGCLALTWIAPKRK